jgi:hypothetical protein
MVLSHGALPVRAVPADRFIFHHEVRAGFFENIFA